MEKKKYVVRRFHEKEKPKERQDQKETIKFWASFSPAAQRELSMSPNRRFISKNYFNFAISLLYCPHKCMKAKKLDLFTFLLRWGALH